MRQKQLWIALVCFIAIAAMADHPRENGTPNKPWEWTDQERLAARADPTARAERLAAHRMQKREQGVEEIGAATAGFGEPVDVIIGKRDPHLFLEWELFDHLMGTAYPADAQTRDAFRAIKQREAEKIGGLPTDFWERLAVITAVYRADRLRERNAAAIADEKERRAELAAVSPLICPDRFAAMVEADREFGPWFEQFLYTVVADGASSFILQPGDPETAMYVARGCR